MGNFNKKNKQIKIKEEEEEEEEEVRDILLFIDSFWP
jgi:hypothetical protein